VRLSNVYGSAPLAVDAVSAAPVGGAAAHAGAAGAVTAAGAGVGGAAVAAVGSGAPGADRPVTFDGRAATVIPPGAEAMSDPVPVAVDGPLAVTIAVPALPAAVSEHPVALQTSWLAPRGAALGTPTTSWLLLSGVDVLAPRPVRAVVAVGDSITDGVGTTPDADARWTDALAARLTAVGGDATMTVLNAGVSRNELLADGVGGPPPQARFARDVTAALGVTDVVLNIGTNDIAAGRDAAAIEAGLARFADAARTAGKRVFLTTITPSTAGTHGTPAAVATRNAVNAWIRTEGRAHAAGVVDFAAAVADPARPDRLAPVADAGDGLHLSAAGYRALAAAVPVTALSGSPCLADDPAALAAS
jgi:lysophospholipase L1-like esterase